MSRIEQLIGEIEEYIDSCDFAPFSHTKIQVNKEELEELLVELRLRVPDEIKRYQQIISNQEAIIAEAHTQADEILAHATEQTNELVNEHEIVQEAYARATEIIEDAQGQAQAIVDQAVADADSIRQGSINYTDEMLQNLQAIVSQSMEDAQGRFESFLSTMQSAYEIVTNNRNELAAGMATAEEEGQGYQG